MQEQQAADTRPPVRLEFIDCIRAIAIVMVIVVHSALEINPGMRLMDLAFLGQRGVQLFYALSAFTIFLSLDRSGLADGEGVVIFFIKRFFRIAPMFYVAIIMHVLAIRWVPSLFGGQITYRQLFLGFTFLLGISPSTINFVAIAGWSVAVETTFYLLAPLLFILIRTTRGAVILTCVMSIVCHFVSTGLAISFSGYENYFSFFWFPAQFPVFLMGIVSFHLFKNYHHLRRTVEDDKRLSSMLLVVAVSLLLISVPLNNRVLLLSSLAAIALIFALAIHPWIAIVNAPVAFIGRISYSMYLTHEYCVVAVSQLLHRVDSRFHTGFAGHWYGTIILFMGAFAASAMLSWVTFQLIEQPGVALGYRMVQRIRSKEAKLQVG